ncbi:MAG: glycosyltransferase family 4 protein [Candidatus Tectomicrobia bacterium]|uniref:Glycosyltransferase family 4 protein n=1 Tax=Tectimicrobiota bacterium TaxID=2528274 RepID=A0A932M2B9_UNCTE|nr:glycosyltransferase family 4 protein [Candidatus Tectomicrobia bacterium]
MIHDGTIKILHTESSAGWGGQEKRILRELTGLSAPDFTLSLACPARSPLALEAATRNIPVYPLAFRRSVDLRAIFTLRGILSRERFHIVHTHSSLDSWNAGLAARFVRHRPRVVRTRHLGGRVKNKLVYSLLSDCIITLSEYMRRYLAERKGVDARKIVVIPSGVDPAAFVPDGNLSEFRKSLGLSSPGPVIGTVSILRGKKGHRILLEAAARLRQEYPGLKVLVVGDGPGRDNLLREAKALELDRTVSFLGFRQDISQILATFDVFVFPSLEEALGTAVLEAMAAGKAVVASRVGGIPEAVVDQETGLLVPPADSGALAEAVRKLLQDPDLRQRMGEQGRLRVEEQFSLNRMLDRTAALYRDLCNGRRRQAGDKHGTG